MLWEVGQCHFLFALGPDGNLWATDLANVAVLTISTSGSVLASTPLLPNVDNTSSPYAICTGPDGNIWIADSGSAMDGVAYGGVWQISCFSPPAGITLSPSGITSKQAFGTPTISLNSSKTIADSMGTNPITGVTYPIYGYADSSSLQTVVRALLFQRGFI